MNVDRNGEVQITKINVRRNNCENRKMDFSGEYDNGHNYTTYYPLCLCIVLTGVSPAVFKILFKIHKQIILYGVLQFCWIQLNIVWFWTVLRCNSCIFSSASFSEEPTMSRHFNPIDWHGQPLWGYYIFKRHVCKHLVWFSCAVNLITNFRVIHRMQCTHFLIFPCKFIRSFSLISPRVRPFRGLHRICNVYKRPFPFNLYHSLSVNVYQWTIETDKTNFKETKIQQEIARFLL